MKNHFAAHLRIKFGLTEESYHELLEQQQNKCAICAIAFDTTKHSQKPNVDHCHETNTIRGLLCFNCNTVLGKVRDSVQTLESAITYLRRTPPKVSLRPNYRTKEELFQIRSKAVSKFHSSEKGQTILKNRLKGELHPNTKYSDGTITEMLSKWHSGAYSKRMLAVEYGCSESYAGLVCRGKLRAIKVTDDA